MGMSEAVKTDKLPASLTEIPHSALVRLGLVFREGAEKYGRGNWRLGVNNKAFQIERLNHAIDHLYKYAHSVETGETLSNEDHLAKVIWFCATQIELERLESIPVDVPTVWTKQEPIKYTAEDTPETYHRKVANLYSNKETK
jgi:hypothetical protein